eukprot:6189123-Pleurochrysis_carterae.AAC.1
MPFCSARRPVMQKLRVCDASTASWHMAIQPTMHRCIERQPHRKNLAKATSAAETLLVPCEFVVQRPVLAPARCASDSTGNA